MDIKRLVLKQIYCANPIYGAEGEATAPCLKSAAYITEGVYTCMECTVNLLREEVHQYRQRLQAKQEGPLNAVVPLLTCGVCKNLGEEFNWCKLLDFTVASLDHIEPLCPLRKGKD